MPDDRIQWESDRPHYKGNITRLHSRTAGERRAIHSYIMRGWDFDAGSVRGESWAGNHHELGLLPRPWRERFVRERPSYVVWGFRTPVAWHVPERWTLEPDHDIGHDVHTHVPAYWVVPGISYSNRQVERAKRIAQVALSLAGPRITLND